LLFVLYGATEVRCHSWDEIAYTARAVDHPLLSDRLLSTQYLHPHHLLYVPWAKVVLTVVAFFRGPVVRPEQALLTLQVANSVLAALTALLAVACMRPRASSPGRRLLLLAGSGFRTPSGTMPPQVR
jgi:hypothetical protein